MPIIKDGVTLKALDFNSTPIKKVIYNGTVVFTANVSVSWSIYYAWDGTGSAFELSAEIVDSEPLSPSDTIRVRVKETQGDVWIYVDLTTASPSNRYSGNFLYFNSNNTVEFLVNDVVKATTNWHRPNIYNSSTESGTVTFEP